MLSKLDLGNSSDVFTFNKAVVDFVRDQQEFFDTDEHSFEHAALEHYNYLEEMADKEERDMLIGSHAKQFRFIARRTHEDGWFPHTD